MSGLAELDWPAVFEYEKQVPGPGQVMSAKQNDTFNLATWRSGSRPPRRRPGARAPWLHLHPGCIPERGMSCAAPLRRSPWPRETGLQFFRLRASPGLQIADVSFGRGPGARVFGTGENTAWCSQARGVLCGGSGRTARRVPLLSNFARLPTAASVFVFHLEGVRHWSSHHRTSCRPMHSKMYSLNAHRTHRFEVVLRIVGTGS